MKNLIRFKLLWGFLLASLLLGFVPAESRCGEKEIRTDVLLASGRKIAAKLLSGDDIGFDFIDIAQGRQFHRDWTDLSEDEALRLKKLLGLHKEPEPKENWFKLQGNEVLVKKEDRVLTIVCLVLTPNPEADGVTEIEIKTRAGKETIAKKDVQKIRSRELDKRDVYTPEELYPMKYEKDPEGWTALLEAAEFCMDIRHYAKCRELLDLAAKTEEGKAEDGKNRILELRKQAVDGQLANARKQVESWIADEKFDRALEQIVIWVKEFPLGEDKQKFLDLEAEVRQAKQEYYADKLPQSYFKLMEELIEAEVRKKDSFANSTTYVSEKMEPVIFAELAKRFDLKESDVKIYFAARNGKKEYKVDAADSSPFLPQIFINKPDDRKGGDKQSRREGGDDPQYSSDDSQLCDFKAPKPQGGGIGDIIPLEKPGRVGGDGKDGKDKKGGDDKKPGGFPDFPKKPGGSDRPLPKPVGGMDAMNWWKDASAGDKKDYLTAYYVTIKRFVFDVKERDCPACKGKGTAKEWRETNPTTPGGKPGKEQVDAPCRKCQGQKNFKTLLYR